MINERLFNAQNFLCSSLMTKIFFSSAKPSISMVHDIAMENVQIKTIVKNVLHLLRFRFQNG
jgi:hypothetical protein